MDGFVELDRIRGKVKETGLDSLSNAELIAILLNFSHGRDDGLFGNVRGKARKDLLSNASLALAMERDVAKAETTNDMGEYDSGEDDNSVWTEEETPNLDVIHVVPMTENAYEEFCTRNHC